MTSMRVLPKLVMAEMPSTYQLSAEQLAFYKENGYLVIKNLIDFTTLYTLKQHFIRICQGVESKGLALIVREPSLVAKKLKPEDHINKISEIVYDDVFFSYAQHPRMLHVLTQFLGENITAMNSMFLNKPPGTTRHPPHQDLYYFPFGPSDNIIGVWTAIDDVTTENGCLYVVPGSHKPNIVYPHGDKELENKLYHGVQNEAALAPESARIDLEMSPGDTVFFHPCLVHGSRPNISTKYRRSISFHFAGGACRYGPAAISASVARDAEAVWRARGYGEIDYVELWKIKSRQLCGVRCHL